MLKPSDFNNAVPQFPNGNYASNPINPQYIAEPDAENYNRGTEPLQTLPAQWWNWFVNKFTARFNKVNIYVKNIFNELAQVLSIFNITPDGTEQTPTTSQLKTVFETCYPQYVKTAANLVGTETTVNGHPLSSNVTVTRSDLGLGTSATVNTGTAAGCIPTVGTALGTTNNNILVTDSTGKLKPSGITVGTAAGCDATLFNGIPNTGFATCCFTWVSTQTSFAGAPSEWAHYLISSHGDGSNCYNYIIREPFTTVPQYSRMVNGTQSGWYNFITDENIGSQSVSYASCAGSATSAGSSDWATNSCCARGVLIDGCTYCGKFYWIAQNGQPSWLWGTNDGVNIYIWNPANFNVNYANSAGETQRLKSFHISDNQSIGTYYYYENGRTCMYSNVTILYWIDTYDTASAQILKGGKSTQISTYEEANPNISYARLN